MPLEVPRSEQPASFPPDFSYTAYISRVKIEKLIEANALVNEIRREAPRSSPCILCGPLLHDESALRLNDGSWLCESCLRSLRLIKYPEKYQRLYEDHLKRKAARELALEEYNQKHPAAGRLRRHECARLIAGSVIGLSCFAGLLMGLGLIQQSAGALEATLGMGLAALAAYLGFNSAAHRAEGQLREAVEEWEARNPPSPEPELRHFHDPLADLTERDLRVLRVLDYWPGYPPYWDYLREVVLGRDGNCCQITGCPSRLELHIHHKIPLAQGGSHRPENLVALCVYHHGMQEDLGHERIRGPIITEYFVMVRSYTRADGTRVRAHVRHRTFPTSEEIRQVMVHFGVLCPSCRLEPAMVLDRARYRVILNCPVCRRPWRLKLSILEEIGPKICKEFLTTRNNRTWENWKSYIYDTSS